MKVISSFAQVAADENSAVHSDTGRWRLSYLHGCLKTEVKQMVIHPESATQMLL